MSEAVPDYQLYWGDIHNHNRFVCGQGSLERSYEIAASHLDFYALTPHAQYCDGHAPDGYELVKQNWTGIQKTAAEYNRPGQFTTFLAYEWHSHQWGHYCVYYEDDHQPLHLAMTLERLQDYIRNHQRAIMVPHHIAYHNGIDWDLFEESIMPVIEIFSEHGCGERDGGPFAYLGHSLGPGGGRFNVQHGLGIGKRFGFTGGTDNHDGYPGGYGLGLTGVYAAQNTRPAIFEAIRARRTFAVTGDRIAVDFSADGAPMGSTVSVNGGVNLSFSVEGWDTLRHVELIRNNLPVMQACPDFSVPAPTGVQTYRFRIEWGWGPMKGYQIYDWTGSITIDHGKLTHVVPCFRSDPFDEHRRKEITGQDDQHCAWQSHTSRGGIITSRNSALACGPTDAIAIEIHGTQDTTIEIELDCSTRQSIVSTPVDWSVNNATDSKHLSTTLGQLLQGGQHLDFTDKMLTWAHVHRAVPSQLYRLSGSLRHASAQGAAFYYVRATQDNGHMAWSSPIWISGGA